jgi:hypothetical protein
MPQRYRQFLNREIRLNHAEKPEQGLNGVFQLYKTIGHLPDYSIM